MLDLTPALVQGVLTHLRPSMHCSVKAHAAMTLQLHVSTFMFMTPAQPMGQCAVDVVALTLEA